MRRAVAVRRAAPAVSPVADTEAAAANRATTMPATGIVLLQHAGEWSAAARGRGTGRRSGPRSAASPASSGGRSTMPRGNGGWSARRRRRTPRRSRRPPGRWPAESDGESGSAGGASSKVSTRQTSASERDRRRRSRTGAASACDSAWMPPMMGPSATAPKMQMFMITAVSAACPRGNRCASGGTAAISSRLVQRPWITWPTMNIARVLRRWRRAPSRPPAAPRSRTSIRR